MLYVMQTEVSSTADLLRVTLRSRVLETQMLEIDRLSSIVGRRAAIGRSSIAWHVCLVVGGEFGASSDRKSLRYCAIRAACR